MRLKNCSIKELGFIKLASLLSTLSFWLALKEAFAIWLSNLRWLPWLIWNWFLRTNVCIICYAKICYSFYNQVMQNPIPKLRWTSIISKKPSFLSEKLKTLTSSNYHSVEYLFCTRFLLLVSTKKCEIFFNFV